VGAVKASLPLTPAKPSFERLGLLLMLALPAFYAAWLFRDALFHGRLLFGTDTLSLGLPQDYAARRAWVQGQWPLWIPELLGGSPGIASLNLNFLYPLYLAGAWLGIPAHTLYGWDGFFHVCLSAWGTMLFARSLGVSRGGALLAGLAYGLSGTQVSLIYAGHVNNVKALAFIPWVFWGAQRAIISARWSGRLMYWGCAGLAIALQILGGGIQIFAYTMPAVLAFVLWHAWAQAAPLERAPSLRRGGLGLAWAFGVALLLAAPLLLPSWQYKALSWRQDFSYVDFTSWSFPPWEGLQWFVPGFFGWKDPGYSGAWDFCLTSDYFGLLPWVLATAALWRLGWKGRRPERFFAGLALAAFAVAVGKYLPLHHLFFHLPVYSGFRSWTRALCLLTFSVSILAGFGWDQLWVGSAQARQGVLVALGLIAAVALLAMAYAPAWSQKAAAVDSFAQKNGGAEAAKTLVQKDAGGSGARALGFSLLLLAGLWALPRAQKAQAAGLALALLAAVHLADVQDMHQRYIAFSEIGNVVTMPEQLRVLPDPLQGEPYRVFTQGVFMNPNQLEYWGFENIDGYHALPLSGPRRLRDAMAQRSMDYWNLMGVRYFVLPHPVQGPGLKPLTQGSPFIYENGAALPRAGMVYAARQASDLDGVFKLASDPSFDPRREALLEEASGSLPPKPGRWAVQWLRRSPLDLQLQVQSEQPGLLVLAQAWYPLWRAQVDGHPVALLRADGALQAVHLDAGTHQVRLDYVDNRFALGLWGTLLGLLALIFPAAWLWRHRPRTA
jgi:hypothetical protein